MSIVVHSLLVFAVIQTSRSLTTKERINCDASVVFDGKSSTSMATMGVQNKPQAIMSNKRGVNIPEFLPCEPWNSCIGRCTESEERQISHLPPYTCYCDDSCPVYKDCCADFEYTCNKPRSSSLFSKRSLVFTCIDLGWDLYGILMVHRCPPTWMGEKDIRNGCESHAEIDIRPISDDSGIVYRNLFCAMCNGLNITNITRWRNSKWCEEQSNSDPSCKKGFQVPSQFAHEDSYFPRKCFHHVGECPRRLFETAPHTALSCYIYSGMVTVEGSNGTLKKYKNPHCALCNDVPASKLSCPQWKWMYSYRAPETMLQSVAIEDRVRDRAANELFKIKPVKTPSPQEDIPPSVSILLNFGLNGKKHMLFSSSNSDWMMLNDGKCSDSYIWDPFIQVCRKLSCTGNFNLVNFECVESDENNGEEFSRSSRELSEAVMGIEANVVAIYLTLEVNTVTVEDEDLLAAAIEDNFKDILASSIGISSDRITNVTVLKNDTAENETSIEEPTLQVGHNYTNQRLDTTTTQTTDNEIKPNDSSANNLDYMMDYKKSGGGSISVLACVHDATQNDSHLVFHTTSVNLAFYLTEPESEDSFEPSVDRVVSLITTCINLNTLFMVVADISVQIRGIHEETVVSDTEQLKDWCLDGERREYMSSEFTVVTNDIVTDDWHMKIHINRTGMYYIKGEFLANFIFQGSQGDGGLTNISGIVVVCENRSKILNEVSCPRLTLNESEYRILDDKTVSLNHNASRKTTYSWGEYELLADNYLSICFKTQVSTDMQPYGIWPTFDLVQAYVNLVLMSISLWATTATLVTYSLFSELRNLPGINLMNLAATVFVSQLTFLLGMRGSVTGIACRLVAIFIHYAILASFFWSNVMAFDLYKTFGSSSVLPHMRSKLKYVRFYLLYAYACPMIITAIAVVMDSCQCVNGLRVSYGVNNICWIGDPVSTAVFFAVPLTILFFVNFVFYITTIISIRRVTKMTRLTCNQRGRNDVMLYIRMSSVMGFTWVFGLASAFTGEDSSLLIWIKRILIYLFIVFYASQGLMIFGAFSCNKRVSKLYKLRIQEIVKRIPLKQCVNCKKLFCSCQHSISRSTSVETCQSTVSE